MDRVASPVEYTEEDLAVVRFGADGLVPAIVQDAGDGAVLMLGYMDGEALRRTLQTGSVLVLEPEPERVLVQGGDVGRPAVGAGRALRL